MRNYIARIEIIRDCAQLVVEIPVETYPADIIKFPGGLPYQLAKFRATASARHIVTATGSEGYRLQMIALNPTKNSYNEWSERD